MHKTTARLFAAIEDRYPGEAVTSKVAAKMNVADNRVTNWKARGISFEGAVQAEVVFGIPAAWIMYGQQPLQTDQWPFDKWVRKEEITALSEADLGYVAHSIRAALNDISRAQGSKSAIKRSS
ncbi:hypothetical protein [Castellaniella sp. S9]|uniref:hypothetical protein n=1 Tax=Castellaniella sp. S9 TaxID=2993652 RepID=UPI0022B4CEED|nr:hypothetical protein [Castellaniella sp. S9]